MNASDRAALRDWAGLLSYPDAWDVLQDRSKVDPCELARALVLHLDAPLEIHEVVERFASQDRREQAELALLEAQLAGLIDPAEAARLSLLIQAAKGPTELPAAVDADLPGVVPSWEVNRPVPQAWKAADILGWLHGGADRPRDLTAWEPAPGDEPARRLVAATALWLAPEHWSVAGVTELVAALVEFLGASWNGALDRHGSDFLCRIHGLSHPSLPALGAAVLPDGLPLWLPHLAGSEPPVIAEPVIVRVHWTDTQRVHGVLRCHARTLLPLVPDPARRRERFLARIGPDLPLHAAVPAEAALPATPWSRAQTEAFAVDALYFLNVEIKPSALRRLVELAGEQPPVLLHLLRETLAWIHSRSDRSISWRDVNEAWLHASSGAVALVRPLLQADRDLVPMFVAVGLGGPGSRETLVEFFNLVTERPPAEADVCLAALVELALVQREGELFRHAASGIVAALYEHLAAENLAEPRPPASLEQFFEDRLRVAGGYEDASKRAEDINVLLEDAVRSGLSDDQLGRLASAAASQLLRDGSLHSMRDVVDRFRTGTELVAARLLVRLGDFAAARTRCEPLFEAGSRDADTLAVEAEISRGLHELERAMDRYRRIREIGTAEQRLAALAGEADVVRLEHPAHAVQLLESEAQPLLEQVEDRLIRARYHRALADVLADRGVLGDLDRAEAIVLEHVLPAAATSRDVLEQIAAEDSLARILRRRARPAIDGVPGDRERELARIPRAIELAERTQGPAADRLRRALSTPSIDGLVLVDFKNLERFETEFSPGATLLGRWSCIVGLNGSGKTSILQAIVWALSGASYRALGEQHLRRARRRIGDETRAASIQLRLSIGSAKVVIAVSVSADATIVHEVRTETEVDVWSELKRHVVVAYGAGRNLSARTLQSSEGYPEFVQRVRPLIEPFTQLAAADLLLNAERPGGRHDTERRAALLLKRLLPRVFDDGFSTLDDDGSALRFRAVDTTVEAVELAEGYRVAAAWLADLCLAWAQTAPNEAADGDPARIRATVLIDELDAHLHVELQRVIVPRLRRALPEVQWIVTTHSPYIAASFDRRELIVLADREGKTRTLDRQIVSFSVSEICEWLLGTSPHSREVEELLQSKQPGVADVLGQSPSISENDIERIVEWRKRMTERGTE